MNNIELLKSWIEKSEGSRGGKVIGHTSSGKPIYEKVGHKSHKNFTGKDHHEAYALHYILGLFARGVNMKKVKKHGKQQRLHREKWEAHEKSGERIPSFDTSVGKVHVGEKKPSPKLKLVKK